MTISRFKHYKISKIKGCRSAYAVKETRSRYAGQGFEAVGK